MTAGSLRWAAISRHGGRAAAQPEGGRVLGPEGRGRQPPGRPHEGEQVQRGRRPGAPALTVYGRTRRPAASSSHGPSCRGGTFSAPRRPARRRPAAAG